MEMSVENECNPVSGNDCFFSESSFKAYSFAYQTLMVGSLASNAKCEDAKTIPVKTPPDEKEKKPKPKDQNVTVKPITEVSPGSRNPTQYAFLRPHVPFPKVSSISNDEHYKYIHLQLRVSKKLRLSKTDYQLYWNLQKKVNQEQKEFNAFARKVAKQNKKTYNFLHPEVDCYMKELLRNHYARVYNFPHHYDSLLKLTSDADPTNRQLLHLKTLLQLGEIPRLLLPHFRERVFVPLDYTKISQHYPIGDTLYNTSEILHKQVVSKDPNAIKLASKYHAHVVISSSALKVLFNNVNLKQTTSFEIPVKVTWSDNKDGSEKIVFIDKPFITKHMNAMQRNRLYHKYALKRMLLHPRTLNVSEGKKLTEHCTNSTSASSDENWLDDENFDDLDVFGIVKTPLENVFVQTKSSSTEKLDQDLNLMNHEELEKLNNSAHTLESETKSTMKDANYDESIQELLKSLSTDDEDELVIAIESDRASNSNKLEASKSEEISTLKLENTLMNDDDHGRFDEPDQKSQERLSTSEEGELVIVEDYSPGLNESVSSLSLDTPTAKLEVACLMSNGDEPNQELQEMLSDDERELVIAEDPGPFTNFNQSGSSKSQEPPTAECEDVTYLANNETVTDNINNGELKSDRESQETLPTDDDDDDKGILVIAEDLNECQNSNIDTTTQCVVMRTTESEACITTNNVTMTDDENGNHNLEETSSGLSKSSPTLMETSFSESLDDESLSSDEDKLVIEEKCEIEDLPVSSNTRRASQRVASRRFSPSTSNSVDSTPSPKKRKATREEIKSPVDYCGIMTRARTKHSKTGIDSKTIVTEKERLSLNKSKCQKMSKDITQLVRDVLGDSSSDESVSDDAQQAVAESTETAVEEKKIVEITQNVNENSDIGKSTGTTLDEILKMQEKLLSTTVQNQHVTKTKKPVHKNILIPSTSEYYMGNEMANEIEDPKDYLSPSQYKNASYNLWSIGDIKLLIRCSVHGKQSCSSTASHTPCTIIPKMECQAAFGAEAVTNEELMQQWIMSKIRPNNKVIRARVNNATSEIMVIEDYEIDPQESLTHQLALNMLYKIFHELNLLSSGQYLLKHDKGEEFISVMKQSDTAKRGTLDLHSSYNYVLDENAKPIEDAPWLPLDGSTYFNYHKVLRWIPATFKLPNTKYAFTSQSQKTKARKLKKRLA